MVRDATARFFDAMAASYDEIEPWYVHLYARLHRIVRDALRPERPAAVALDAGCGTGFQTAILAELGYRAHGVDLSSGALAAARRRLGAAPLARGDLLALPFAPASFDAVVCAGSTIDFVDDPARAIAELGRVLRPGARLLLEYERRFCPELGWMLVGGLTRDALRYGVGARDAWRLVLRRRSEGVWVDYPGYPRLRLFTDREVDAMLRGAGLATERAWAIHAITNLLPSTVLHRPRLSRPLRGMYHALCAADAACTDRRWARAIAAHAVVLARKSP